MTKPNYFSKYTLQDYIAEMVKKKATPPPPSPRDFFRAAKKEVIAKSDSTLSVEAQPFHPQITRLYISVISLFSPTKTFQVPVSSSLLPLSTLRQYFPLATNLHYISNQQMVSLARSSSYTIVEDSVELSQQKFCIPFLGTEVTYVVTDESDLVVEEMSGFVMDDIVNFVRNIHDQIMTNLTEVKKMEDLVGQLQKQLRKKVRKDVSKKRSLFNLDAFTPNMDVMDQACFSRLGNVHVVENLVNHRQEYPELLECFVNKEGTENNVVVAGNVVSDHLGITNDKYIESSNSENFGVSSIKDENQNYVDDYGFSDTDEDNSGDLFNTGLIETPKHVQMNSSKIQPKKFPEQGYIPVSHHRLVISSHSSRPRCVNRIV